MTAFYGPTAFIIPLNAVPSQIVTTTVAGKFCKLFVYQTTTGLYINVALNGILVIGGVICQYGNYIVRDSYLGFPGDLLFFDTRGQNDPDYTGLGVRYFLTYVPQS